jgi:hypothetical protein
MRLYYNYEFDIFCVVADGQIWKFIGEFCEDQLFEVTAPAFNEWYEAWVHPEHSLANFEFLGQI